MGLRDRWKRGAASSRRRPKGGTRSRDAFVPPEPVAAAGDPPPSPGDALTAAGVAPPRPLVWTGTAASGVHLWSSPVANGVGMDLWGDLVDSADAAGMWPVLTGATPLPASWHLDTARPLDEVTVPDGNALIQARQDSAPPALEGLRTRLEPVEEPALEAALAAGYVTLVSGATGWQVPLAVGVHGLGGWSAPEHAAVLQLWAQRYRARLVALTNDSVGLHVGRPPRTHDGAMDAAQEIYAYCPDVVVHGVRTMWGLATTMAVSSTWSLRWSS